MYKLLLSWRYLKTRFIALASIVSVTLGVATLIVVNSVMSGFVEQMKSRLHGILSDVEIAAPLLGEIPYPEEHVRIIKEVIGDDLESLTCVVRNPALLSFDFHGRPWTQQVMLLGVDDETFGKVTDFEPYLTNAIKRAEFSFRLEEEGYDALVDESGWPYRRKKVSERRALEALLNERASHNELTASNYVRQLEHAKHMQPKIAAEATSHSSGEKAPSSTGTGETPAFTPLPPVAPDFDAIHRARSAGDPRNTQPQLAARPSEQQDEFASATGDQSAQFSPFDPHAHLRPRLSPEEMFDPYRDQHTGIILGIAISSRKFAKEDGTIMDIHMVRPGDDVQIMFPTVGANAKPVSENCTVVDFYSSNMHEYDSTFAFMPLSELQRIRGMVDPVTQDASVSAIQIKLREGADLNQVRDKLIARFPPSQVPYDIHTWLDTQAPLLSAVNMELTILNILLFLIIAVAGFGILATFFMIVVEKTKDIGILKALGAPSRGVMSIFLGYGMSLGTVGTGAGILLGLLFLRYINEIADLVALVTGQEVFDPTIYYFSEIPTIVSPWMVVWVGFGAILIAVLASVLPALRAARLHPVEALRYE
jgi:lipoprotein-releasing system permease protein